MKGFKATLASALVLFMGAAPSAADDFSRSGWYVGIGPQGQFYLLRDEVESESANLLTVSNTVGFMVRGGYRLTSWFAAELMYEYAPGFNLETNRSFALSAVSPGLPNIPKGTKLLELTGNTATANAKFILPFWRLQPYLMLGLGGSIVSVDDPFGLSDASKAALAGRLAFGGDIYLTHNLVAFLELSALLTTFDIGDPTASQNLSLLYYLAPQGGLQWRF